jgi:MFS family permease
MGPAASFIFPVRRLAGCLCRPQDKRRPFSSWGVLRNRSFRSYFAGSVTSDFGTWLQNTAQVLLAYRLTHSPFAVGLVTCAQFSSPLVLGPWAGVMTDRFGSRQTLLATQVVAALIAVWLAVLDFSGVLNEWWLVIGAITTGLAFTFALPARNVTVRRLVPEAEAQPAFAMDSVSYNLGRATAPPLSVLLAETLGFGWAFAANAASFLIFAAFLVRAGRGSVEPRPGKDQSKLRDGFVIAVREPMIMILLLMVAAVTIADDPVLVLGPMLASHFHVSASWSGWFIAALGGGTVLGSLRPARRKPSLRLAAVALTALVLCMLLFVLAPWVWGSFAAALGAGITCLIANSATRTLLARQAGEKREASVMAVWAIAWAGSKPLASLADGLLASRVGVQWTGVLLILPALALILAVILWSVLGRRLAAPSQRPALTIAEKTADEGVSSEGSRGSPSG